MTSGPTIDYEALQQDAMRGLVRAVLAEVAKTGLPGDHHFYISFNTRAPGVGLSRRLKEKYPREMTIVLQHRFWGLTVNEDRFEVNLTFDGIPERLVIPFQAIVVFFDPSVRFGHQFESADIGPDPREAAAQEKAAETRSAESGSATRGNASATTATTRPAAQRKPRSQKKARPAEPSEKDAAPAAAGESAPAESAATAKPVETEIPAGEDASKVVSLDAFRKR